MGGSQIQNRHRILLLGAHSDEAGRIHALLQESGSEHFELHCESSWEKGLKNLQEEHFDLLLLDGQTHGEHKLEQLLRPIRKYSSWIPILVFTGRADMAKGVAVIGLGAQDLIHKKDLNATMLARVIDYSIARKRFEERQLHTEKRLQKLIETSSDAILIVNRTGRVLFLNPASLALFQKQRSELIDQSFGLPLTPGETEIDLIRPGGGSIPVEMRVQELEWEQDTVFYVSLRDISRRKNDEKKLQDFRKLESISILAGGISHDYNNLLAAIYGYIQLAQMESKPGDTVYENLAEAIKSVERATQLTKRFILLSEATRVKKRPGVLKKTIEEVIERVTELQTVDIQLSFQEELLPAEIDPSLFGQALENVLLNALEAVKTKGRVEVRVNNMHIDQEYLNWTLPIRSGNYVNIQVMDQGPGIGKEDLNKVFDPYFSTKDRGPQKGMGLGLTMAYTIMKNHGGHITVVSEPGQGTTVDMYLPVELEVDSTA